MEAAASMGAVIDLGGMGAVKDERGTGAVGGMGATAAMGAAVSTARDMVSKWTGKKELFYHMVVCVQKKYFYTW